MKKRSEDRGQRSAMIKNVPFVEIGAPGVVHFDAKGKPQGKAKGKGPAKRKRR